MKNPDLSYQPSDYYMDKKIDSAEREQEYLDKLKTRFKPSDLFDLREHDKEVALGFKKFASLYFNGEIIDEEPNKDITDDELWDIYCSTIN